MKFAEETYERDKPSKEDEEVISSTASILFGSSEPNYKAVEGASMSGKTQEGLGLDGVTSGDAMVQQALAPFIGGNIDLQRLLDV
jgi:hypothetical protein